MAVFAGESPAGEAGAAWDRVRAAFERFDAPDRYVFSVPMWNAVVPYVLTQLIDVVSQPGMVFSFDPERGYTGLLRGKRAVLVLTSAVYGPGRPASFGADFQAPYLRDWLAWAGVSDVQEVSLRPGLVTADADGARRRAHAAARDVAAKF